MGDRGAVRGQGRAARPRRRRQGRVRRGAARRRLPRRRDARTSTRTRRSSTPPRKAWEPTPAGRLHRARGDDADDVRVLRGLEELALRGRREGAEETAFVAASRLQDIADILGGLVLVYDNVEPTIARPTPPAGRADRHRAAASSSSTPRGLRDEEAAGKKFTPRRPTRSARRHRTAPRRSPARSARRPGGSGSPSCADADVRAAPGAPAPGWRPRARARAGRRAGAGAAARRPRSRGAPPARCATRCSTRRRS